MSLTPAGGNVGIAQKADGTVILVNADADGNLAFAPASGSVQVISGRGYQGTFTVTRGANQTPYTAGDVVGGALTIANAGPDSGYVLYTRAMLLLNISALPAGMSTFGLRLYSVTPPSAIADNAPWTLGAGDRASYLGSILGLPAVLTGTGTATVTASLTDFVREFKLTGGANLFAYLVTDGGFTPAANSETYSGSLYGIAP